MRHKRATASCDLLPALLRHDPTGLDAPVTNALSPRSGLLAAAGAVLLAIAALYATGNPTVTPALCRLHLPNTTIPGRFRSAVQEPCMVYGRRVQFQGVLWSDGGSGSGFVPGSMFGDSATSRGRIGETGFALVLDDRSDPDGLLRSARGEPPRAGRFVVTLYGWPSHGEGRFGPGGLHGQQILVDRIVGVARAPEPVIEAPDADAQFRDPAPYRDGAIRQ